VSRIATPSTPPPAAPAARFRRILRRLGRTFVHLLAIVGFVTLVRPFLFDLTPLASGSMSPTLKGDQNSGDWVLAEKVSYWFRAPRRWEVVEFRDREGLKIMKRVIAFPGESVAVKNNALQVDGQSVQKPAGTAAVKYYPYGNLNGGKPFAVTEGYYVLGDDSVDSDDSRFEGPVPPQRVSARAWLIVWPPSRMGWVR
jgi:signal peptidase I